MNSLTSPAPSTRRAIPVALALLALLAGCATQAPLTGPGSAPSPPPAGQVPGAAPARPAAPPPVSPLVAEQRWLDEWFHGTPVVIALTDASSTLNVEVPLANSFDAGRSTIKPALAAVLERVATSLRRQAAMRVTIAAPADTNGAAALATTRAQQVREHLIARGVAASRVTMAGAARAGAPVHLRLVIAPQPISRLDDATLPVPPQAFKPATPASAAKR